MKRRGLILVAAACLTSGALHWLSLPRPTGPAEGQGAEGPAATPAATSTLRLGAFNIRGGKGTDGQRDLDRVADCLRGLDFVALNEVHGPRFWQAEHQTERLGRALGMQWLFAPSTRTWLRFDSGNGLLSTVPLGHWQRIPLVRRHDRSYRNALLVELQHAGRTIQTLVTHVNRNSDAERETQLREVVALFLALQAPAVLMGDLNSTRDDPQIRALLAANGVSDALANCDGELLEAQHAGRIDWIFTRGMRTLAGGLIDRGASDHPLVWAELEYADVPPSTGRLAVD